MRITVVTAVLNGEAFLRETIESVLSQAGEVDLEYIVRDGGSTDATLDILAQYDRRLTVVSEPDGSPQAGINAGMAAAAGDIGCWLNADDLLEPGALRRVVAAFSGHADRDWLYGRCRIIDETGQEIRRPVTWYKNGLSRVYSRHLLLCTNVISQPATFWRMPLWRRAGGLSEAFPTTFDYDLWLRMGKLSRPLVVPEHLARFRRHPGSISETRFADQFEEECRAAAPHGTACHRLCHRLLASLTVWTYRALSSRERRRRQRSAGDA